jgi:Mn2+/Fe2+ NRAMP family transporter
MEKPSNWLRLIGPGLLVAATGVGAGDLASAGFAGSHLGTAILWAVLVGAFFKFVITEGLMRWQLATGQTLLEGMAHRLGRIPGWLFLPYLLLWSFFVGSALMSACGVTLHAIFPVFENGVTAKIVFGIASSLVGLILVFIGGFRLFEKIMSVCIAIMFVTVVVSAIMLAPDVVAIFKGLFLPHIPKLESDGVSWTMALMGGVGGTVTILCYGYWIAEIGRKNSNDISVCRIDLGVGYLMTALFGIAMVIIASSVKVTGSGTGLIVATANALQTALGPAGRWMFLIGAFGAVFSSLLGVWQSVPYLFADLWRLFLKPGQNEGVDTVIDTRSLPYRAYLVALATIPTLGLLMEFRSLQKLNGMVGAAFLPLITIILLLMNGRKAWMGQFSNRPLTVLVLVSILLFFGGMACSQWLFE